MNLSPPGRRQDTSPESPSPALQEFPAAELWRSPFPLKCLSSSHPSIAHRMEKGAGSLEPAPPAVGQIRLFKIYSLPAGCAWNRPGASRVKAALRRAPLCPRAGHGGRLCGNHAAQVSQLTATPFVGAKPAPLGAPRRVLPSADGGNRSDPSFPGTCASGRTLLMTGWATISREIEASLSKNVALPRF